MPKKVSLTNDGPTKWCIELCVRRLEMRPNSTEWHLKMDNRKLIFRFPANKQLHGVLIVVVIVVPWPFQRARSRMLQKHWGPLATIYPTQRRWFIKFWEMRIRAPLPLLEPPSSLCAQNIGRNKAGYTAVRCVPPSHSLPRLLPRPLVTSYPFPLPSPSPNIWEKTGYWCTDGQTLL